MANADRTSKAKAVKQPVKRGKQVAFSQSDLGLIKDAALNRGLTAPQIAREQSSRGWPVRTVRQWVVKAKAGVEMRVKRKAGWGQEGEERRPRRISQKSTERRRGDNKQDGSGPWQGGRKLQPSAIRT